MEIKKQILSPRFSFALATDEDVFIDLELNKTFSDLKTERINNVFNINEQYNSERQNSLKFCIFGLVESKFENTGNLIIDAKDSTNLILHLPKIAIDNISQRNISIRTFELTLGSNGMSRNLYGKTKSAYSLLFEIDKKELEAQDARTRRRGQIPKTRTIDFSIIDGDKNLFFTAKVPYLFYDLDGNPVPFGFQTSDIDENGNTLEIDNDFPFLYDRHWIRNYFDIPAPSFVFLPDRVLNVRENTPSGSTQFQIALDQKSPYGLERVNVVLDVDGTVRNPNEDFVFTTQTISWNVGEQYKTFNFGVIDDKYVENDESVFLKVANFKYCVPKSDEETKMEIKIINEDVASEIRFYSGVTTVKSNASTITVDYVLNKPLDVPGQSIVMYYTTNTTAILGTDFILDINNPSATELKINFNQGDISGSTTISVIDNDVYDVDKIIELAFRDPTQNIILSNVGASVNVGPVFIATIQDSIVTQFSSFVLINNPTKNITAVKSFKSPDADNRYSWNGDIETGFGIATSYEISIRNIGEDIVFNNKIIKKNSIVEKISVSGQQISDIVMMLPSNTTYDKPNKRYKKSKYNFEVVSKEKFIANEFSNFGFGLGQSFGYQTINIESEKDAGPSGSSKYYLTTKLKNFYLNYDTTLSACTIDGTFNDIEFAYTNNLVFQGYNQFGGGADVSSTEFTFENFKMPSFCSQFLPFGFSKMPNAPYKSDYININFRNVYPQSVILGDEYNNLKFDSENINHLVENSKKGFLKWADSSLSTRQAMVLSILNNGDIDVDISGKTISPGNKFSVRGFEQEINDLSITLVANESFSVKKSGFTIANYILSVENVNYFSSDGQTSGSPISFTFNSTNNLTAGPLSATPQYFVASEYSGMIVPFEGVSTHTVNCDTSSFLGILGVSISLEKVAVRGLLLPKSKSGFIQGYFLDSNNDVELTCVSSSSGRIPFKLLQ